MEKIRALLKQLETEIALATEEAVRKAVNVLLSHLGGDAFSAHGRRTGYTTIEPSNSSIRKTRRPFLCLRNGCKNVGAPIYGMVCTEHKDTPKAEIRKLRAARKAQ